MFIKSVNATNHDAELVHKDIKCPGGVLLLRWCYIRWRIGSNPNLNRYTNVVDFIPQSGTYVPS